MRKIKWNMLLQKLWSYDTRYHESVKINIWSLTIDGKFRIKEVLLYWGFKYLILAYSTPSLLLWNVRNFLWKKDRRGTRGDGYIQIYTWQGGEERGER